MMNLKIAEKVAKNLGVFLSPEANEILEKIEMRGGLCPCRIDGSKCPCKYMKTELEEINQCHCGLFTKYKIL